MSAPPFQLRHIDHVVLRARDIERMRDFYCRVLGCPLERARAELGLWQLRAGRALIDLVDVNGPLGREAGAAPAEGGHNMDHLCLALAGYDEGAIMAYLRAEGVRVGEAGSRYGAEGMGRSIYLWDPEGNRLELKGPGTIPPTRRN